MVTCYDATNARLLRMSGVHCALVGDSVSMVVHGFPSTVHATLEMMELHTAAVARGLQSGATYLVADLPFLSYRKGSPLALEAVDRLIKAGAQAVKLEGVWGHEQTILDIVQSGVPVMGHIGLTPQSIHGLGGFRVQGRDEKTAKDLIAQAKRLEELGCFSLVLECVPRWIAKAITEELKISTIGIGAGPSTDGQVLVLQDLLGMNTSFKPKFVRHFSNGEALLISAFEKFCSEVQSGNYPSETEGYD